MPAVTMPKLSDSMEEGTIVRWLIADGQQVAVGDELVEVETDKATIAYEAEAAGTLTITLQEGASAPVGATIAHIGEVPAAAAAAGASGAAEAGAAGAVEAEAGAAGAAGAGPIVDASAGGFLVAAAPSQSTAQAASSPATPHTNGRVKASPIARRLARALGVDLAGLAGSGPGGRIVKRDVEQAAQAAPAVAAPAPQVAAAAAAVPSAPGRERELIPLSSVQATIARRMTQAKTTIPDFTLTLDVDMEAAVAMRAQFGEIAGEAKPPSLGDFVIRACALALRAHPDANAGYVDGAIERHARINVGVAVAAPGALFVPTVFDADTKSLHQIAAEVRELAKAGRTGSLTPTQVGGATFTVSNLGMYGISHFTAVLNPPQVAILAVGAVQQRVVVRGDAPAVRHLMTVTLTCDHRVLYGADGAAFLADVRANLEQPIKLVL